MIGAVASGHPLTSEAAGEILRAGGNAFDAVVSAGFASVVTEPTLTSLGGGGFLLAHIEREKRDILFDFFVNAPGKGIKINKKPSMEPVYVRFPKCIQVFYIGYVSVAVPGVLKGLLYVHERLCSLPLNRLLEPALRYLKEGVVINKRQEIFLRLLEPIMTYSEYGRKIFSPNGRYAREGDRIFNPDLESFLKRLIEKGEDFYSGETGSRLVQIIQKSKGIMTLNDLSEYQVIEREPLKISYRGRTILTNPQPSMGGVLLEKALDYLETHGLPDSRQGPEFYRSMAYVMRYISKHNTPISTQGTTHISIIDRGRNAASMTISNGSGSGCYIPDTGIMLNNMMGEEELHPGGFFTIPPGERIPSMMMPTIVLKDDKVEYVLGSGGSKRIKTAILQTIVNLIDYKLPIMNAVESPRIHYEEDILHVEPGIDDEIISLLEREFSISTWPAKDMYFGGVHCVGTEMKGWGDTRRGGSIVIIE